MIDETVDIRPATKADIPAMLTVWYDAFGPNYLGGPGLAEETLHWQLSSSAAKGRNWGWVAVLENEVVGAWLSLPIELSLHGQLVEAHWLASTAIATKGQRKGLGRRIYRKIVEQESVVLGAGVVPASRALYESESAVFLRFDAFASLEIGTAMAFRWIFGYLRRLDFVGARTQLSAWMRSRKFNRPSKFEISIEEEIPKVVGFFLEKALPKYPVIVNRDEKFIASLLSHPRFEAKLFVASLDGEMQGYAIVRSDGLILDLLVDPTATGAARALLDSVILWAIRQGRSRIYSILPGAASLRESYVNSGFIERNDFGLFFAPTGNTKIDLALKNTDGWYLSLADSDLWSFRLGKL